MSCHSPLEAWSLSSLPFVFPLMGHLLPLLLVAEIKLQMTEVGTRVLLVHPPLMCLPSTHGGSSPTPTLLSCPPLLPLSLSLSTHSLTLSQPVTTHQTCAPQTCKNYTRRRKKMTQKWALRGNKLLYRHARCYLKKR